jgi:ribosome-associated translation inhibitor RaiA
MEIGIEAHVRGGLSPLNELQPHLVHRLSFVLRRFQNSVRKITVRLTDQNGPRKGVDTRCVITATVDRGPALVVEATSAWPTASITAAVSRLDEALRRRLDRAHRTRRRSGRQRAEAED